MRYDQFKAATKGWTLAELRCDVPPSDGLLAVMDAVGLGKYERFVLRLQRETTPNGNRLYDADGRRVTVPE